MSKRSKTSFQDEWLQIEKYKSWISKVPGQPFKAKCQLSMKDFDVGNMGKSSLDSHAGSKKHKDRVKTRESMSTLYFDKNSSEAPSDSRSSNSVSSPTLDSMLKSVSVSHAEIRWVIKVVLSSSSFRSCLELNELFKAMFSDSAIASSFQLSKTKCSYYVNYGLAPFIKDLLAKDVRSSPYFSVLFNESLNNILQQSQMDIQLRFWSDSDGLVKTRYYDSQFLSRPNAENLASSLSESLTGISMQKMHYLAMDGPYVNWNVFELLNAERCENEFPSLINIGSCGLHVVHGAFKTGFQSVDWDLNKVFKAMWKFFHDSPARRDIYVRINSSSDFPLSFCATRWVEGEQVASRALTAWPNVVNVILHFLSLAQSKRTKNNKS